MSEQKKMWKRIWSIRANITDEPWLILGDFNEVLHVDKQQGPRDKSDVGLADFRRLVEEVELMEMHTGGSFHLDQWCYQSNAL